MYFLYNNTTKGKVEIIESENKTYGELVKEGYVLQGQFGRLDYAEHWTDYKNGKITEDEHKKFLNL